jgi:response regulator RpfG family c-di-GMP phosphodiesterase
LLVAREVAKVEDVESNAVSHGSETILIVDDDPDVREIMSSVLAELGYHVKEAGNGEAALDIQKDVPAGSDGP